MQHFSNPSRQTDTELPGERPSIFDLEDHPLTTTFQNEDKTKNTGNKFNSPYNHNYDSIDSTSAVIGNGLNLYFNHSQQEEQDEQEDQLLREIYEDVEVPQGRHLGVFSTLVLFVSRMVGTGIFATPSSIWVDCNGIPWIYALVWILALLLAFSGLYLFLELGSWSPRSGGKKNFLVMAFNRPYLMMNVTYSVFAILTGWSISNAIVFGKYFIFTFNSTLTTADTTLNSNSNTRLLSIGVILFVVLVHGSSVKTGIKIQNSLGFLKFTLIFLMSLISLYSIIFDLKSEPEAATSKSVTINIEPVTNGLPSFSSFASAFITALYCFSGWDSVHSVISEIKNPKRTLIISGPLSLIICFTFYSLMNLAYYKNLTFEEISKAGPLIGSIFFVKIFGENLGSRLISMSIALSAISNMFVVLYSISRMNQQILRDGFLPMAKFLSSNWPNDSPLPALLIAGFLSIFWLLILPNNSESTAFNYLINMEGYGNLIFLLLIAIGLFRIRKKMKPNLPKIKSPFIGTLFIILVSLYLLVAPIVEFCPPTKAGRTFGWKINWYDPVNHNLSYQFMSLLIILICFCYWAIRFKLLPYMFNYSLQPLNLKLKDGLTVTQWVSKEIE
ncbi:hypothetical protein TBLA_0G00720 [Henningerozyma blattae CBS 6284]|uniref:Amino acid permease/ SLC12A domain-containing protein n=1 Tax=Henningerozyma blattae (strain ATCC 34711 / CBS 6284 / DSM 70876 / NBRC 10599 / NRRL Y-10934 / UCD 77-7) TaxID=1071380 RepID=I2H6L7_HENB6|nr:hypothetical protein TBLA_0G00720 [Tetrapisispora blattae CBS 6284]CCH62019.1 hypothetical protein TBLA_0G00720 [Tetrapisispora blattae CBS 6284]